MINLQRKTPSEKVGRLRYADPQDFEGLSRKLARWSAGHMGEFAKLRPSLPEALNDRQQDNWDHLFAVAGLAGAGWPDKARKAALAICGLSRKTQATAPCFSPTFAMRLREMAATL